MNKIEKYETHKELQQEYSEEQKENKNKFADYCRKIGITWMVCLMKDNTLFVLSDLRFGSFKNSKNAVNMDFCKVRNTKTIIDPQQHKISIEW